MIRGLGARAWDYGNPVEGDLRDDAVMRAGQPRLHGVPVNYVSQIVKVEEAAVVSPDAVSAVDLDVANVGAAGSVVRIPGEIPACEERQRVVTRSYQG